MWPLPIVDFSFALVVFLDIFSLLILLRRLLRSLRGDDNVIIRIFVRFVVIFFFDIVPRGRFLMLGIRGIVLLLDVLGLLAWDVTGDYHGSRLPPYHPAPRQERALLRSRRRQHSMVGLHWWPLCQRLPGRRRTSAPE